MGAGAGIGAAVVVVSAAWTFGPRGGAVAAAAAWVTCAGAGLLAWWLARLLSDPQQVLLQVLAAMAVRTGIPLAVCMGVYFRPGAWARAGFVYYLLIFYFVTLVVETWMLVAGITAAEPRPEDAPAQHDGLDHG